MGLFEKLFKTKKSKTIAGTRWEPLTAYKSAFTTWRGEVYEFDQVRAAIDCLARNTAKLKPILTGTAERNMRTQLKNQPNKYMTWYQFLYRTRTIWEMQNNAIIVPILDEYNRTVGVFPVLPSSCEIVEDMAGREYVRFEFSGGKRGAMELEKCGIVTKYQYRDDIFGSSNTALNGTCDLLDLNRQAIKEAIKNTSTFRFMGRMNNFAQDEDIKAERKRVKDANLSDNEGFLLLFSNLIDDVKQVDVKPWTIDDKQLAVINQNIEKYYGVTTEAITNSLVGDQASAFYEGAIEPFAIQLSEVLSRMLFSNIQRNNGNAIVFSANRIQFMTNSDKLNISSAMADRGLMTINEIREIWELQPIEGGDRLIARGEYYYMDPTEDPSKQEQEAEDNAN